MPLQDAEGQSGPTTARLADIPRPESLLLAFFGAHLLDRESAVAVGSVIDVLGVLGVGEHAARATLKRMAQRGLLRATRQGRQAYVSLTPRAVIVLREGANRLGARVTDRNWDGHWALLAFSVPESRRDDRHALRTRLRWAGFGLLRDGLWIAPSADGVTDKLADLDLLDYVKIFRAESLTPADPRLLVGEAWDLSGLARAYRSFLDRWEQGARDTLDALTGRMLLEAEWLLLIRDDPSLPLSLLPDEWPGIAAEEAFRSLRQKVLEPSQRLAEATLSWLSLPSESR
jgi:DNA-binding transcriptional regulator PaaX